MVSETYTTLEGLVVGLKGIGVSMHIFVPYNDKIADITHADTDKHTINLATIFSESRKIIGVIVKPIRISGTGYLLFYANEGNYSNGQSNGLVIPTILISAGTQRLQYALTASGEDFDLYCLGYIVEA